MLCVLYVVCQYFHRWKKNIDFSNLRTINCLHCGCFFSESNFRQRVRICLGAPAKRWRQRQQRRGDRGRLLFWLLQRRPSKRHRSPARGILQVNIQIWKHERKHLYFEILSKYLNAKTGEIIHLSTKRNQGAGIFLIYPWLAFHLPF